METFIERFKRFKDFSFVGMRQAAMSFLPTEKTKLDNLYHDLQRGIGILDDTSHLNMYLRSFGKMHKAKLDAAYNCIPQHDQPFSEEIQIFDWGCGQGVATICLLDYLKEHSIHYKIRKINLIEPSLPALQRARDVIEAIDNTIQIRTICKKFDTLTEEDFVPSTGVVIHLFSNILDVNFFDLAEFTHLFQKVFTGNNKFICVGPYYYNNRRVDDFIAAIDPDNIYATCSRAKGQWINDWTISLRVFDKKSTKIDDIQKIRQRIEDSHKKDQMFAGYILDAVEEEYKKTDNIEDFESLYHSLSVFEVESNHVLDVKEPTNSKFLVLANILSRGLPTKAPISLEKYFSVFFKISTKPGEGQIIQYSSTNKVSSNDIFEALHIIDPRFNINYYNGDMLESDFEKSFIDSLLVSEKLKFLIQLLEPQRDLSSIINLPNKLFSKDQHVDFAIQNPYGNSKVGFICELDGIPHCSNLVSRSAEDEFNSIVSYRNCEIHHIQTVNDIDFLTQRNSLSSFDKYISILEKNSKKEISADWKETLQIILSPIAIARVERVLIQSILSGCLDRHTDIWKILVVERDVPCAAIAIEHFKESFENLSLLEGKNEKIPQIQLSIVSTKEFKNSPLHLGREVTETVPNIHYDLCIDISVLLRNKVDALPLDIDSEYFYVVRSSHYQKKNRVICTGENIEYSPMVKKDSSGNFIYLKDKEECLTFFLREIFRKPSFRTGQLPIISHILADKTTIGLLPTGGGKSLTYQLSCLLQPGVAIVVDPLVSLMVDQVKALNLLRIDACDCIHALIKADEKNTKTNHLLNGSLMFVLLSPERFMSETFREALLSMSRDNSVYFSYGIIDEVHCVSEWGHDFRTSYLHLGRNMINYMKTSSGRPLSLLGLTATASFDVLADVERELTLGGNLTIDSDTIVRSEDDSRPELTYRIIPVQANYSTLRKEENTYILDVTDDWDLKKFVSEAKRECLVNLMKQIPSDLIELNQKNADYRIENLHKDTYYHPNSHGEYQFGGIIFCPHAYGQFGVLDIAIDVPGVATFIQSAMPNDAAVGTFIGGDDPDKDMKHFNNNLLNEMVATKAFGMGIDKPNIRHVIHINHPSSIESYVQEAGRGGRDKKNAISYILYDSTEFLHLTVNHVNDIRYWMGKNHDPIWLEKYCDKYILMSDLKKFCITNGCSKKEAKDIENIVRQNNFQQNVDKDINVWFHNNSFRGMYKEKVILTEMTDRILNAKPTLLIEIQAKLREATGNNDIQLYLLLKKNSLKIISTEDVSKQYLFIFLSNLSPSYKFINFSLDQCTFIYDELKKILLSYEHYSAEDLSKPIEGFESTNEGIYGAMRRADADGSVYVTVSWENHIKQCTADLETRVLAEVSQIAKQNNWNGITEENIKRYGLKLEKINDFEGLLKRISLLSNDKNRNWMRHHGDINMFSRLRHIFCERRDKDDTDKAIYRMCCVGIVEDVTIDYQSQTYELKIKKRTDEEYKDYMLSFFKKYYSNREAQKRVSEIDNQRGRNYLDKCLGYLTAYIYQNLERKRYRAIDDMCSACEYSVLNRKETQNDDWLKEFIHLYFNSKYARRDYRVGDESYSLSVDTDDEKRSDFGITLKYMEVISKDSSNSEIDNVKHLYGATLMCLRAHEDNAALQLLLSYCISFLGVGTNTSLKANAWNAYLSGFLSIYENDDTDFWSKVDKFNSIIIKTAKENSIKKYITEEGKQTLSLLIHEKKFSQIVNKYTH